MRSGRDSTSCPSDAMRAPPSITVAAGRRRADAQQAPRPGKPRSAELVGRLTALRDLVTDHARARRAEGVAVGCVLGEMESLVARAERLEGWPDEVGVLLGQVRLWTVAAYAEEPELQNAPRFY